MKYRVEVARNAKNAIFVQARFIAEDKPQAAEGWLNRVFDSMDTLESMPRRHPLAAKLSEELGLEVRRLVIGDYLLFFCVHDEAGVVEVLRFRHGAQRPLLEAKE